MAHHGEFDESQCSTCTISISVCWTGFLDCFPVQPPKGAPQFCRNAGFTKPPAPELASGRKEALDAVAIFHGFAATFINKDRLPSEAACDSDAKRKVLRIAQNRPD